MNDHHGDAVGGAVMGIIMVRRMLVVAVVKILHCAVCSVQCAVSNITKLRLGRLEFPYCIYERFKAA